MNFLASECSSGCESGWTNYLEQSFLSAKPSHRGNGFNDRKSGVCDGHRENRGKEEVDHDDEFVEEEEDLSMVSDASSGPPHFYEDNGYFNDDNQYQFIASKDATLIEKGSKRHRNKEHLRRQVDQELASFLDDTASSPLINFSKNNFVHTNNQASMESVFDYPEQFSATHFQGGPAFQDNFGSILQSSPPGNHLQNNHFPANLLENAKTASCPQFQAIKDKRPQESKPCRPLLACAGQGEELFDIFNDIV
ncbi:hypothetical protein PTKIN_Ptkin02bG0165700 [Pterospermum kingtungense]